jgi:hypothetical protein
MTGDRNRLGELFDTHMAAEFQSRVIEATMATMGGSPHVTHVPTMTGGNGRDGVRHFYDTWFIGKWPEDTVVRPLSRTVGENGLVDEVTSALPNCEMPALLPSARCQRRTLAMRQCPTSETSRARRPPSARSSGRRRRAQSAHIMDN